MGGIKKIEKDYLVTDDSVNVYGFRLLTSGYLMDKFQANPIGFYLHAPEDMPRSQGVLVRWSDFRIDGDKVYAKPNINLNHPRGERTVSEIENGFLNAASVGKIVVVEFSDSPDLMLPGQTGPTVTKWYHKELSLVDIPGNENALSPQLYDVDGSEINLADFLHTTFKNIPPTEGRFNNFKTPNIDMSLKNSIISALNLADNATDEALAAAINGLVAKANKATQLETNLADMKKAKEKAETDLADLKKGMNAQMVQDLIDKAGSKVSAKLAEQLKTDYAENPEGLKSLIDSMPAYNSVVDAITGNAKGAKDLADKTWEELDKSGQLPDLKAADIDLFKAKYKQRFGKDYTG